MITDKTIVYIRTNEIYTDSRATKEITALIESGYSVHIIGWSKSGNIEEAIKSCNEVFDKYANQVTYAFYDAKIDSNIGFKNIHKLIGWFFWTKRKLKKIKNYQVVHLCDLDAAFGVAKMLKIKNKKFVYDIYDYYIDCHYVPSIFRNIVEKAECNVIDNAEFTIICTEERQEQIAKANPQKVIVIHNSPDIEKGADSAYIYDYAYFGGLNEGRLINEIFEYYPQNKDMHFAIGGYGTFNEYALKLSDKYKNFDFYGRVSYDKVLAKERECRVISAIYEPNKRNHRLCAPNKFYEALALSKPVIVCQGTGIDKIVTKYNIGLVIDYDADEFYQALRRLIQNPQICAQMGKKGRELYEKNYSWSIMKERLLSAYQQLLVESYD